eukprot:2202450-Pleurochrysis_carterae.AAC.1
MSVPFACAGAVAVAIAPTADFVSNWLLLAWRAQANAARRRSMRGVAAIDNRRTHTCALAQTTPLSASRSDALTHTVHHALRAHILSACCCLTLACVYSYWIHGSALLGINTRAMPLLSAYPSAVGISPAVAL